MTSEEDVLLKTPEQKKNVKVREKTDRSDLSYGFA
jgi:hypothetical protein